MQPSGAALCDARKVQRARGLDHSSAECQLVAPVSSVGSRCMHTRSSAPPQFSRLHADMQEESRHDRAALQQLASSLASPTSIPLLK